MATKSFVPWAKLNKTNIPSETLILRYDKFMKDCYNSLWMKDCDMLGGSYDHDKPVLFI